MQILDVKVETEEGCRGVSVYVDNWTVIINLQIIYRVWMEPVLSWSLLGREDREEIRRGKVICPDNK